MNSYKNMLPTLQESSEYSLSESCRKASTSAPELDRHCSPTPKYKPPTYAPPGFQSTTPIRRLSFAEPPAYRPPDNTQVRKRAMSSPLFPPKFSRSDSETLDPVTPTIITPPVFGREPQIGFCATCDKQQLSVTKKKIGKASKLTFGLVAASIAIVFAPATPLAIGILFNSDLKDTVHKCSKCKSRMGKHRQVL